ncbi:FecR family protein [Mucilaginibacter pineti]|uniref:FecR family protein n=1 Tax=Mucilaginibacter pineti TaxID=1391627 RepID=A0A1G7H489_9SPHI|nr:FecR domain-containing protein [Mucilaginibacter pineti]SDE95175.1 FecR family protein [Mucilaginibacter pineti]
MKKRNTDFNTYTLQDLLDDPKFINWVLLPKEPLNIYWNAIQNSYPNLSVLISKARQLVLSLQFKEERMAEDEQRQLWQQITAQTSKHKTTTRIIPIWMRGAAAALLIGFLFSAAFYFYINRKTEIATAYGQITTIVLPDSSEVTLNANSKLQYTPYWNKEQVREVWITGEAYFKVNHLHKAGKITSGDRFVVHAGKIDVEVLGTIFNVNDRRGLINVALISGKVSMGLAASHKAPVIMRPGDVLEYQARQDTIIRKQMKPANKVAWKDGVLVFEQITAGELFDQLADIYGYKVVIKRPEIKLKKISGRFTSNDEEKLFKGISLALGVSINKDEANHALIVQ